MKLELDIYDLKPEFVRVPTQQLKITHFTEQVQNAIRVVGSAKFVRNRGTKQETYKVIHTT